MDNIETRRQYGLIFLFTAFLAGCSASANYDIDVKCVNGYPYFEENYILSNEDTTVLECYTPEYFQIKCAKNTVQKLGDERLCSTHDGKIVRIRLFDKK